MCKHCERIVERPQDKPIVHAFMTRTAENLSRLRGTFITADDIECSITLTKEWVPSGIGDAMIPKRGGRPGEQESARSAIFRMLEDMHR
jgi:hypothetical protein